mgnify:CR=1 FL=1
MTSQTLVLQSVVLMPGLPSPKHGERQIKHSRSGGMFSNCSHGAGRTSRGPGYVL